MPPLRVQKYRLAKPALAVTSMLLALAIALPTWQYVRKRSKKPRHSPYGLQLVDDAGRALGTPHGPLKLVIDPFTVYRLQPNQKTKRLTVNHWGGRGAAEDDDRSAVAFLGGSACFGQELASDDDVFTTHLKANRSTRWFNFGCPGYCSGQELSFYIHRLRELAPEIVVSVSGWNDCFAAVQGAPLGDGMYGFNGMFFEIRDRLAAFHCGGSPNSPSPHDVSRDQSFERAAKTYIDNMLDLERITKARGAGFVWAIQPELGAKSNRSQYENDILTVWEKHYRYSPKEFSRRYAELRRRSKAAALKHGVTFVDLNESDAWKSKSDVLFADVVHPNADGHRAIAEAILPTLEKLRRAQPSATAN
jgi:lysophospholipase L1-like esterase